MFCLGSCLPWVEGQIGCTLDFTSTMVSLLFPLSLLSWLACVSSSVQITCTCYSDVLDAKGNSGVRLFRLQDVVGIGLRIAANGSFIYAYFSSFAPSYLILLYYPEG